MQLRTVSFKVGRYKWGGDVPSTQVSQTYTYVQVKTRNIGARTKVMGRKNFQESINYCFHKQKVTVYCLHNMYVNEFRGDPLFKTARKYINERNG